MLILAWPVIPPFRIPSLESLPIPFEFRKDFIFDTREVKQHIQVMGLNDR